MIQRAGLAFQQRQIMQRIEQSLPPLPATTVLGYDRAAIEETHLVGRAADGQRLMGIGGRHRVVIGVEAPQRQRVDGHHLHSTRFKRLGWQRQEGRLVGREQSGDGLIATGQGPLLIAEAALGQAGVEFVPAAGFGDGDEEVPADMADAILGVALLLGFTHATEVGSEKEVALQSMELGGQVAFVGPEVPGDGDLAVVVADAFGDAAEEEKGGDVSGVEGLGAFAGVSHGEASAGVGQGENEEGGATALSGNDDSGMSVIALGLAGRMKQGNEDLGLGLLEGTDGIANDTGTAAVTMFVAEAIVDASGGMALFGWGVLVIVQDLLNDGEERSENRAWAWL